MPTSGTLTRARLGTSLKDMSKRVNIGEKAASEADYVRRLAHARRLFAWCRVRYGATRATEAEREARKCFPYEGSDRPYRLQVFHDSPWHYAMQHLHGDMYWTHDRTLESPTPEYGEESARITEP